MYKSFLLILTLSLLFSCSVENEFNGSFHYSPKNAKAGSEVTVKYNSDSTVLAGKEGVKCIAYLYGTHLLNTLDVPLNQNGSVYTGKVKTTEATLGILFKFKADDVIDNNDKNGYVIYLSDDEGKNIAGSIAGYAAAINRWGAYYLDLDRNKEKALKLFSTEFKSNPEVKRDFLQPYLETIHAVRLEDREKMILEELTELEEEKKIEVNDIELLATWHSKLNNEQKQHYYEQILRQEFPESDYLQEKLYREFRAEKDVNDKIEMLNQFENDFPESKYIKTMYDLIANSYRDSKDYDKALGFLKKNKNKVSPYRFYLVVNRMIEENADMNLAKEIIKLGDVRNRMEVNNPVAEKPEYYSESEWQDEREYFLGLNSFVYGNVLYKIEQKSESLPLLEEAVELTKSKEGDINDLYSKALVETGKFSKALNEISRFIKTGNSTVRMKDYLQEAYINENGTTDGFDAYAAQFENAAKEMLIKKLKNDMILEPAPDFSLKDLDGKIISISDYKGKTLVVDFWATWCGPCLASFPGMKKAVEKYQENENVKFLFINSWERVENIKENAQKFLSENDYPFHVLLDDKNEVIEKFRVSGIPTKFLVDANGNIRFKSIGFQGTADQLVEEISVMISLVN